MVVTSVAELVDPHGKVMIAPCSCVKGLLASPLLLPVLAGLGADQVTWRLFEQMQTQKGIKCKPRRV